MARDHRSSVGMKPELDGRFSELQASANVIAAVPSKELIHAILAQVAAAEEVVLDTMDLRIRKNGRPKPLKICDHHLPS